MTITAANLNVKIFADGANREAILKHYADPLIKGFTTNPTLMRQAGIADYEAFARDILSTIKDRPISFEVFSDNFDEMYDQARKIGEWGDNVYVKIPITNTLGESALPLLSSLSATGIKLNVTALFTTDQVEQVSRALAEAAPSYISVFAGRIADTGVDPLPIMRESRAIIEACKQQELIWASPRELYNLVQADDIGCHIITVTSEILFKLSTLGKSLEQCSLETVRMFRNDAIAAGFVL